MTTVAASSENGTLAIMTAGDGERNGLKFSKKRPRQCLQRYGHGRLPPSSDVGRSRRWFGTAARNRLVLRSRLCVLRMLLVLPSVAGRERASGDRLFVIGLSIVLRRYR